jgi:hypothetical protein
MITSRSHKLYEFFPTSADAIVRVSFSDGEIFRLKSCYAVDETVYDKKGLWCGVIVETVKVLAEKSKRLRAGNGLDFLEDEIIEIYDEASQQFLFKH